MFLGVQLLVKVCALQYFFYFVDVISLFSVKQILHSNDSLQQKVYQKKHVLRILRNIVTNGGTL